MVELELTMSDLDRFLRRREIGASCWLWSGSRTKAGYGRYGIRDGWEYAHRAAWYFANGAWPSPGLVVRHRCDNPGCVNPSHLELGTKAQNSADMVERGRSTKGRASKASGERHHQAKLTDSLVAQIRDDSRSSRVVAKEIGVSRSLVQMVRAGEIWKHVPSNRPLARGPIQRHWIEANGIRDTISGWGRRTGLGGNCIRARLRIGWDPAVAVTQPKKEAS